jgi:phage terminase large subunit-like protein
MTKSFRREDSHGSQLPIDLSNLTREQLEDLYGTLAELDKRTRYNKLAYVFPDTGPRSRHLYVKQVDFMNASQNYPELLLCGANRSGKSFTLAYFAAMHITGIYPDWYKGKRFYGDITVWLTSLTAAVTRDVIQTYLLGEMSDMGSGFIPKDKILEARPKHGVPNAIDTFVTQREDGGKCRAVFKSYDQGRRAFQGDSVELILNDEEPEDPEIYSEQLTRTMTTQGLVVTGFTPLRGLSKVVLRFLEGGLFPSNHVPQHNNNLYVERVDWQDVPHLSENDKERMLKSYLPHEIEARSKGIPCVGQGKIYPIPESDFVVDSFPIPNHWPKVYGLDVATSGRTACIWAALDTDTISEDDPIVYLYSEYYSSREFPDVHAINIKKKGEWIPGVIDPASNRDKLMNNSLMQQYRELGLDVSNAKNSIESGLLKVTNMLTSGRLKVLNTCGNWIQEYRNYMFDDKGEVKKNQADHLMDATRYLIMSGLVRAVRPPRDFDIKDNNRYFDNQMSSPRTGY